MDPNVTLARIRELVSELIGVEFDPDSNQGGVIDDAAELAEQVKALDEWMSRGGFVPREWTSLADRWKR